MGGNSTKATSGINGAGTQTQQELGIPDNAKIFFEDTKRSVSHPSVTIAMPHLNHPSRPGTSLVMILFKFSQGALVMR